MSNFSLIYITCRKMPMFQWLADGLCYQCKDGNFPEIIVVDEILHYRESERRQELADIVKGRFAYKHVKMKPTVWSGPHRLTTQDYFSASNARNTGICYASTPYVLFMDDLSIMVGNYMSNARHAAEHRYVVGGSYKKVYDLVVENGAAKSWREWPGGIDSRWSRGSDAGKVKVDGGALFGCSCGFPMDALFKINGFDEIYDSMGAEDYSCAIALEKHGYDIWYNRNLHTLESEDLHHESYNDGKVYKRVIKPGNPDQSWVLLHRLQAEKKPRAFGNHFEIAKLRAQILNGGSFHIPTEPSKHWFDGQPLSTM